MTDIIERAEAALEKAKATPLNRRLRTGPLIVLSSVVPELVAELKAENAAYREMRERWIHTEDLLRATWAENARLRKLIASPESDPPAFADTCCGKCPGDTCYVDQMTGA